MSQRKPPTTTAVMKKKIEPHKSVYSILLSHRKQPFYLKSKFPTEFELLQKVKKKRHSIRMIKALQTAETDQTKKVTLIRHILRTSPPLKSLKTIIDRNHLKRYELIFLQTIALRGLRNLTIESNEFKDRDLRVISRSLGSMINLQVLKITSNKMNNVNDQTIKILSNHLKRLRNLRDLHLNFFKEDDFSKAPNYTPLLKIFKHLPNLKSLSLGFKPWSNFEDSALYKLAQNPISLRSLKSFSLSTSEFNKDCSDGWLYLLDGLGEKLSIESLKLDFSSCNYLHYYSSCGIIQILTRFRELRKLELDFSGTDFSDKHVQQAIGVIDGLKKLEKVRLRTKRCKSVTAKGMRAWKKLLESYQDWDS